MPNDEPVGDSPPLPRVCTLGPLQVELNGVSAAAMSRLADHAAAAAQLETAAALLARDPDAPARLAVDVQLALARACIDLDGIDGACAAIRAAAHVARRRGWADGVAMAAIRGADVVDPGGAWQEELEVLLIEAVSAGEQLDDCVHAARGRCRADRGAASSAVGHGLIDRHRGAGSRHLLRRHPPPPPLAVTLV